MSNQIENGPMRETAITALKTRAQRIIRRGQQLLALAKALEDIENSATQGTNGDSRHPYIGVGSDAAEALWELITSYRGA